MLSNNNEEKAFIALNRFGYGASSEGLANLKQEPLNFLKSQLQSPKIPTHLADTGEVKKLSEFLNARKGKNSREKKAQIRPILKNYYTQFVFDLTTEKLTSTQPFIERLTSFWFNHFTVSISKFSTIGLVRDYQYKAIRPYVTGKFSDMLIAVCQHPAMLFYLDNNISFGPNSKIGRKKKRGLNENLAREILELHSLGVNGGYKQKDVVELTKILTGWTIKKNRNGKLEAVFNFVPQGHEPGTKTLLGYKYQENGMNEAIEALTMLANHPSTAKHLARKMATHFVSDDPPETLIKKLETAFLNSGGNLGSMAKALINAPESWEEPISKIKPTPDFIISAFRALGYKPNKLEILSSFSILDYKEFNAPSPQGFSDQNNYWATPGSIMKRIEWSQEFSKRLTINTNPYELAKKLFGPIMKKNTAFGLKGAESGKQGISLLLMSPEFQRR